MEGGGTNPEPVAAARGQSTRAPTVQGSCVKISCPYVGVPVLSGSFQYRTTGVTLLGPVPSRSAACILARSAGGFLAASCIILK